MKSVCISLIKMRKSKMETVKENKEIEIKVENDQLLVSSLEVAENFEREHRNVVQTIRNLTAEKLAVKSMFYESTYKNSRGKTYPMYYMNRDGFSLLVMGFNGNEALEWKVKYIKAFNEMEQRLKNPIKELTGKELMAKALIEAHAVLEEKEKQIEELKPKALFADAMEVSEGSVPVVTLAKMLTQNGVVIGQNKLFAWLRDNGYLIKRYGQTWNLPTQRYAESGLFELKPNFDYDENGKQFERKPTTYVTCKGQKYFIDKFLKLNEKGE